jgi:hypothetical protein
MFHRKLLGPIKTEELGERNQVTGVKGEGVKVKARLSRYPLPLPLYPFLLATSLFMKL